MAKHQPDIGRTQRDILLAGCLLPRLSTDELVYPSLLGR